MPLIINGIEIRIGDPLTLNQHAPKICHAPEGLRVEIFAIRSDGEDIGLYSPYEAVSGWHDLDGELDSSHRGWWVNRNQLAMLMDIEPRIYKLKEGVVFYKGIDLSGRTCQILGQLDNGLVFIELEENIGGCSADGLGKAGHCIAVKPEFLIAVKQNKKARSK